MTDLETMWFFIGGALGVFGTILGGLVVLAWPVRGTRLLPFMQPPMPKPTGIRPPPSKPQGLGSVRIAGREHSIIPCPMCGGMTIEREAKT